MALELNSDQLFKISWAYLQREKCAPSSFLAPICLLKCRMVGIQNTTQTQRWIACVEGYETQRVNKLTLECLFLNFIIYEKNTFISLSFFTLFLSLALKTTSDQCQVLHPSCYFFLNSLYKSSAILDVHCSFRKHYAFSHLTFCSIYFFSTVEDVPQSSCLKLSSLQSHFSFLWSQILIKA